VSTKLFKVITFLPGVLRRRKRRNDIRRRFGRRPRHALRRLGRRRRQRRGAATGVVVDHVAELVVDPKLALLVLPGDHLSPVAVVSKAGAYPINFHSIGVPAQSPKLLIETPPLTGKPPLLHEVHWPARCQFLQRI